MIDFATQVRLTRILLNWRQYRLAESMGVTPSTISQWETAQREPHPMTKRHFHIFADMHGIAFDERGYPSLEADLPDSSHTVPTVGKNQTLWRSCSEDFITSG